MAVQIIQDMHLCRRTLRGLVCEHTLVKAHVPSCEKETHTKCTHHVRGASIWRLIELPLSHGCCHLLQIVEAKEAGAAGLIGVIAQVRFGMIYPKGGKEQTPWRHVDSLEIFSNGINNPVISFLLNHSIAAINHISSEDHIAWHVASCCCCYPRAPPSVRCHFKCPMHPHPAGQWARHCRHEQLLSGPWPGCACGGRKLQGELR